MDRESEKEKTNSKAKPLILLLLTVFAASVIAVGSAFLVKSCSAGSASYTYTSAENPGGVDMIIDHDASGSYDGYNTMEPGVAVSGVGYMIASAGERELTVDLYNPEENAGLYYQTFELRLYDDGEQSYEVLYVSGLVEPGSHLQKITLSRALEKGVYKAVIHVQPYRMDEGRTLTNNADIKTKLIVK